LVTALNSPLTDERLPEFGSPTMEGYGDAHKAGERTA